MSSARIAIAVMIAGGCRPATEAHEPPAQLDAPSPAVAPAWVASSTEEAQAFEVAEIQADGGWVCARSRQGQVACWGDQFRWGELTWEPPTATPHRLEGIDDARDIALGGGLYILRGDDSVTFVRDREQRPQPGFEDMAQLEQADNGVCGRRNDGTILCHGWISWAETSGERARPLPLRDATGLACGARGCCSWAATGALECVGDSESLRFSREPTRLDVTHVDGVDFGGDMACARTSSGRWCWGDDPSQRFGELWTPPPEARIFPGEEPCWLIDDELTCLGHDEPWTVAGVAALHREGDRVACVVSPAGGASCWGDNESGSLGDGVPLMASAPLEVAGVTATRISAAHGETCVVTTEDLVCWGLGSGTPSRAGAAPPILGRSQYLAGCGISGGVQCHYRARDGRYELERFGHSSGSVAVAMDRVGNVCRIDDTGSIACRYSFGEGGLDEAWTPLHTPEPTRAAAPTASGFVLLGESGAVYEWKDARFDDDPDFVDAPTTTPRAEPVGISDATEIAAHQNGGCAATKAGPVKCWGGLGFAHDYATRATSTIAGLDGAVGLSANHFHVCGIVQGEVRCFGDNEHGQLGRVTPGDGSREAMPVQLPGPAAEVAVGADHTCARLVDGRVFCWGSDSRGQLGQGRTIHATRPVRTVLGPQRPHAASVPE